MNDIQNLISASLLRLRMKSPFFATLALFAEFIPSEACPTAATDGKDIFFNPGYVRSLSPAQVDGLFLHEVLHAALLHCIRRGVRDRYLWNVAADIVVNGMIAAQGVFELPPGGLRDRQLEHLSVEEIYELLLKQDTEQWNLSCLDLLDGEGTESDSLAQAKRAELEAHWRNALQQATVIAQTVNQGKLPAGLDRELGMLSAAQLDWRSYLWRYLVQTPTDFQGYDRRFIHQRLYLESLIGESVSVYVAVDTSGSIDEEQLRLFLSEVQGILNSYPHLKGELYYADAEIYGLYSLSAIDTIPKPQGGGGTSFVPFFEKVNHSWDGFTQQVCIYLTDGYGSFPEEVPALPVLWVVTPGGLALEDFPFGEAVRLLSI